MSRLRKLVLLLNASYEPIRILSVRQGLELLTRGKVFVEKATDKEVYPGVFLPSVIVLREQVRIPHKRARASKKNIFLRDGYTCQYCGRAFDRSELSLDHILPQSRGGKDTWENLVAACKPCNGRKDDQTPEEAGMPLIRRVIPATVHTSRGILRSLGMQVQDWSFYLFGDSDGDRRFAVQN